jgi:hypothetical protein
MGDHLPTYAGIGSRRVPPDIEGLCTRVAQMMARAGYTLRTGHAIGCDQAFERGAAAAAEVFLPWKDFEWEAPRFSEFVSTIPSVEALTLSSEMHPAPHRLSMAGLRLMGRNAHIADLDDPVHRVICFTLDPSRGGTSHGLRIATSRGIRIDNLADPETRAGYEALCDRAS